MNPLPIDMVEPPGPEPRVTADELDAALTGSGQAANAGAYRAPRRYTFTEQELAEHDALTAARVRHELVNTPETKDFLAGVALEAIHQREIRSAEHDAGKTPFDWVFLVGHLATRAATNLKAGDVEKALHHTITTAAALANWHAQIQGKCDMRPGIASEAA